MKKRLVLIFGIIIILVITLSVIILLIPGKPCAYQRAPREYEQMCDCIGIEKPVTDCIKSCRTTCVGIRKTCYNISYPIDSSADNVPIKDLTNPSKIMISCS